MRIRLVPLVAGMALALSGIGSAQAMGGAMIGLGAAMMMGGMLSWNSMMHQGTHGAETSDRDSEGSGHGPHDRAMSKSESGHMSGDAEYEEQRSATIAPQPVRPDPSVRTSPAADAHGPH